GGSQRSFGSDPRTTAGIFSGGGEGRDMTGSGTTEQTTLAASADADGGRATEAARQDAGDGVAAAEIVDLTERRYPDATGTVEIGVTKVDYTIEGTGPEETPIIHVFGRTSEGDPEHVRVHGFRPYFYAPPDTLPGEFDND